MCRSVGWESSIVCTGDSDAFVVACSVGVSIISCIEVLFSTGQ